MIAYLLTAALLSGQSTTLPLPVQDPAPVAETRAEGQATAREEARAGRRLICRNEPVLGSRFPVRRCRPADLTPEEKALAADQLRRQQSVNLPGCL